ncbi:hypothetical protein Tco_0499190 [Tanacetum coccineum]
MAPMASSDPKVKTCSKTCLKNNETLKKQYNDLRIELNKSQSDLANYKNNEVVFCEKVVVLKRDVSIRDSEINVLRSELEKLKQEKESYQLKIENFENASKSLFAPPTIDLSSSGLEEFQQPEFEGYGLRANKSVCENSSYETKKNSDLLLIEEGFSDNEVMKLSLLLCFDHLQYTCKQKRHLNGQREEKPCGTSKNKMLFVIDPDINTLEPNAMGKVVRTKWFYMLLQQSTFGLDSLSNLIVQQSLKGDYDYMKQEGRIQICNGLVPKRFDRKVYVKASHAGVKVDPLVVNNDRDNNIPLIELKQANSTNFLLDILGCYKDFRSNANKRTLCQSEAFLDVEFKYLGGDYDRFNRLSKRFYIKSSHAMLVFATIMMSLNHVTYAIRVRELCSWMPTFVGGGGSENDEDGYMGKFYQEEEEMPRENDAESKVGIIDDIGEVQTKGEFEQEQGFQCIDMDSYRDVGNDVEPLDSDPFGLASLINKKYGKVNQFVDGKLDQTSGSESIHKQLNGESHKQFGFSLLERMDETIKVDMALGLNMKGCENTFAALIEDNGELI